MTGIAPVTNGVRVTWDGPSGYYQLLQKPTVTGPTWQPFGSPYNVVRNDTVTNLSGSGFFRVSGPSAQYAGAQVCAECHGDVLETVIHTAHFGAYTNAQFVSLGGQTNASCLACHTVGYGAPTGFTSQAATPQLAGVQCENCHGPAAKHAANPDDSTVIPRLELAGTMCGGCHNTQFVPPSVANLHLPYYEDWNASPHQAVLEELKGDFARSSGLISTCGRCHSGTVREAFLENQFLPDAQEASAVGIACATCHDPHQTYTYTNVLTGATYTNQLRNPVSSVQDYHTTGDFATNYNPQINVCAQCHNDRGASWTSTDRPPHHSPQYNLLLGTVGVVDTNNPTAPHFDPSFHARFITNQCVGCHMQTAPYQSPNQPGISGHSVVFALDNTNSYSLCADCHYSSVDPLNASNLVWIVSNLVIHPQIETVRGLLDQWALTKAPAILNTTNNYGTCAWEYTNPGDLSQGCARGPDAGEQQKILAKAPLILMARFNLYLVQYDGSFGTHNFLYSQKLLDIAERCVQAELNK